MLYATRSIEVIRMIEAFCDIGTPVYRELMKAGLPDDVEEFPNGYVATIPGCQWSLNCLAIEKVYDLGWHIHKKPDPRRFNGPGISDLNRAMTLKEQIDVLLRSMRAESNYHSNGVHFGKNEIRVVFPNPKNISEIETRVCEWGRVLDIVHLVRNTAGNSWSPRAVGFTAPGQPCDEAQSSFGNTTFFGGEPATWISVPKSLLSMPAKSMATSRNPVHRSVGEVPDIRYDGLVAPLRSILMTYFPSLGRPSIDLASDIAGVSTRTLQRRLKDVGLTYSDLLDQCAFELSRDLLLNSELTVTEVSLALGYQDASHFTRSFRRIAGVAPSEFRKLH